MIESLKGPYAFNKIILSNWDSNAIGVYYVGAKNQRGNLVVYYVGRAVADGGIRGRLLQHLNESKWHDATHFSFRACNSTIEATLLEKSEIAQYKPKYNTVGVRSLI